MIHSRNIIKKTSASSSITGFINATSAGAPGNTVAALLHNNANFINLYYKLQQCRAPHATTAALITNNNTVRSFYKNMIHRQQEENDEVEEEVEREEGEEGEGEENEQMTWVRDDVDTEAEEKEDTTTTTPHAKHVTKSELDDLIKRRRFHDVIKRCEAAMPHLTPLVVYCYAHSMLRADRSRKLFYKIPELISSSKQKNHTLVELIKAVSLYPDSIGNRNTLVNLLLEKSVELGENGPAAIHIKVDTATSVQQIIDVLESAKQANIRLWNATHSLAASKFVKSGEVALAMDQVTILHNQGLDLHPQVYNELLYYTSTRPNMSSECEYLLKVRVQKMQFPGVTSRTGTLPMSALEVVINGAASVGNFELVERAWKHMSHLGYEHQPHHYHCVFEAYVRAKQYVAAVNTLREMENRQIPLHMQSLEVLSVLLSKNIDEIDAFYYEMLDIVEREGSVPVDMINLIIRACHIAGDVDRGFATFSEIETSTLKMTPNVHTYNYMIMLCSDQFHTCKKLWAEMLAKGIKPSTFTYGAFFRMCDRTRMLPKAIDEFKKTPPSEEVNVTKLLLSLHEMFTKHNMPSGFMNQLEDLFVLYNVRLPRAGRQQQQQRVQPQQFQSQSQPQNRVQSPLPWTAKKTTATAPPAAQKPLQQKKWNNNSNNNNNRNNNNRNNNNNNGQKQQQPATSVDNTQQ